MTRQQTPEGLMAQLLGGAPITKTDSKAAKQDTSKTASGDTGKPVKQDGSKSANGDTDKPAKRDTNKTASKGTGKRAEKTPKKSSAAKTILSPPQKATFYLDAETIDRLDFAWLTLRRITGLRAEVSKSIIADLALQFALDDLEKKGDKSHLARMLVNQYKSKTANH